LAARKAAALQRQIPSIVSSYFTKPDSGLICFNKA
jgi:hypothetical protein